MIDGTEEMRKTLERFNLNSVEDKEKIDFLLLSSRNFNQVLKNVRLQSETPPVELGEIYNENIYTIKSTIIITLLKAIIERKKQLDRLAHYIDKGIHHIYRGIICISVTISIIILNVLISLF